MGPAKIVSLFSLSLSLTPLSHSLARGRDSVFSDASKSTMQCCNERQDILRKEKNKLVPREYLANDHNFGSCECGIAQELHLKYFYITPIN